MSFRHSTLLPCAFIDSLKTYLVVKYIYEKIIVSTKNIYSSVGFVMEKDLGYKLKESVKMWKNEKVRNVV